MYKHTVTIYSNRIILFYSILCINKSWLFQLSFAQRIKIETIVCYWKFKKTWFKKSFSYSTLQQKTSTDNFLAKILWILAASPAVAMNLKLLFHDPYPILIKPFLSESASDAWPQNLIDTLTLPFPLKDTTKILSYWKKNEVSLVLMTGCPGAVWGKGNIWQSLLTSPPPHKFWKPFRIQTEVIWVRGALVKQNKVLSSAYMAQGDPPDPTSIFNVLLLLRMLSQSCLTLCNPMDYSLPRSYVHGILQAEILEWVAISYSGDLPNPGIKLASLCLLQWQLGSLPPSHLGRPIWCIIVYYLSDQRPGNGN